MIALRFLPGAVVDTQGSAEALSSLFVRGGDSRYNKVIFDGFPSTIPAEPSISGSFPWRQRDRLEFVRGAQEHLYGSDAMTSVVQTWTRTGSTPLRNSPSAPTAATSIPPRLRVPGGSTRHLRLQPFRRSVQYRWTGTQRRLLELAAGREPRSAIERSRSALRLRVRHSNAFTGVQGEWNFNGVRAHAADPTSGNGKTICSGVELTVAGPSRWQHRFTGYEYSHQRTNVDTVDDPGRLFDTPFHLHRRHQSRWLRISGRLRGTELGSNHRGLRI